MLHELLRSIRSNPRISSSAAFNEPAELFAVQPWSRGRSAGKASSDKGLMTMTSAISIRPPRSSTRKISPRTASLTERKIDGLCIEMANRKLESSKWTAVSASPRRRHNPRWSSAECHCGWVLDHLRRHAIQDIWTLQARPSAPISESVPAPEPISSTHFPHLRCGRGLSGWHIIWNDPRNQVRLLAPDRAGRG